MFNKVFVTKGNIRKTQMICAWNNVMIIWTEIWAQRGQISLKYYLGCFYRLRFYKQKVYITNLYYCSEKSSIPKMLTDIRNFLLSMKHMTYQIACLSTNKPENILRNCVIVVKPANYQFLLLLPRVNWIVRFPR